MTAPPPAGSTVRRPPPQPPPAVQGSVTVEYSERSSIRVRGAVSGRLYEFSALHPAQKVDGRDAAALLGSRFFRRRA